MPRPTVATLAAAALLGASRAAAQVPDTELRVTADAAGEIESHQLVGVAIAAADSDTSVSYPDGRSYSANAHALAGGGGGSLENPPIADCEASVSATGEIAARASANAYFEHYVKVNGAPPSEVAVYNPPVMARVVYRGETTLAGDLADTTDPFLRPRAAAYFSIYDGFPGPPGAEIMGEQTGADFDQRTGEFSGVRIITILAALLPYPMQVSLLCDLQVGVSNGGSAQGRAMADPIFEFDQEAFDEYAAFAGFPTFDLASHYGFEYSESMVPEPEAAALGVAAFGAMARIARRRSARNRVHGALAQPMVGEH